MGMKCNSGHFNGTNGQRKGQSKFNIQFFADKRIPRKGKILLSKTKDERLKNVIKELYRPGSKIGDGGTAAAIKFEKKTGVPVGGKSHIQKGQERIKNLERIINNPNVSSKDKKVAQKLYNDLNKALGGK